MKKIIVVLLVMASLIAFCGCQPNDKAKATSTTAKVNSSSSASKPQKTCQGFFDYLKTKGFNIGKEVKKEAAIIGADEGACFEVNGNQVEVYYFNQNKLSTLGKKNYDDAKQYGSFNVLDNYPVKCVVNGDLIMLIPDGEDKDKIVDAFKSY